MKATLPGIPHPLRLILLSVCLLAALAITAGYAQAQFVIQAPGVTINLTNLSITEGGASAAYTVVLTSQPTATVTITLTTDSQVIASPTSLTFTTADWDDQQTIIISAPDNTIAQGVRTSTIQHTAASADPVYQGISIASVHVTINDDDTAGVIISPVTLNLNEGGPSDAHTVVLSSQPTATVTITLTTDSQVIASPTSLTFTAADWDDQQTITISAPDNDIAQGVRTSTIQHTAASTDPVYQGISIASVHVTINDDDTAGVIISPITLNLTEGGPSDAYTVVLSSQPTSTVTVTLTTDVQLTTNHAALYFDDTNWNTAQIVLVTAYDDDDAEGTHTGVVTHTAASQALFYDSSLIIENLTATITDNDHVGVTINPTSLSLAEGGAPGSYTIVLASKPKHSVTITISPDAQQTTNPTQVTFNPGNWNNAVSIIVTVVDDAIDEPSPHTGQVTHSASSSDPNYNSIAIPNVSTAITDNDTAGISIAPLNLSVTEGGSSTTYNVVLQSQPTGSVTINISPNSQVSTSSTNLLFDDSNWNTAQTVTVNAVDDFIDEGTHSGAVAHTSSSSDPNYNALTLPDVSITITDNDTADIIVNPTLLNISEGGSSTTYSVVLNSQPLGSVTISVAADSSQVNVNPTTLTFNQSNWGTARNVTVSAVDDEVAEGNHASTIQHSSASTDPLYDQRSISSVTVEITDNDSAGVTVEPTTLNLQEGGPSGQYTVVLSSQPTAAVQVNITHNSQITTSLATLDFDNTNWNITQTIIVTATDDFVDEGLHTSTIQHSASSSDPAYNNATISPVSVQITDNDLAGIQISPTTVSVSEGGLTGTYQIVLTSQPLGGVSINISADTQVSTDVDLIQFSTGNWSVPQNVTVSAIDDLAAENTPHAGLITHQSVSTDPKYDALDLPDVAAEIGDNDSPGLFLRPTSITISEAGATATYQAELTTQPTTTVTVTVPTSNQYNANPGILLFTNQNWNAPQTVTVSAVDDLIAEGTQSLPLQHTVSSPGTPYDEISSSPISVQILDNDTASIEISPAGVQTTTEDGGQASYQVRLNSQPIETVTLVLESQDVSEGQVLIPRTGVLTFYTNTWNIPQSMAIIGRDDEEDDDQITYTVSIDAASPDPIYNTLSLMLTLVNLDNDGPTITASDITVVEGDSGTSQAVFTLAISPTTNVPITLDYWTTDGTALAGSDYIAISDTLTIPSGASTAQIIVQVINDTIPEYRESFFLHLANPSSQASLAASQVRASIRDNDPAVIRLPLVAKNWSAVLFFDDFSQAKGWRVIAEPGSSTYLQNGEYHIRHTIANRNVRVVAPVASASIPASFKIETLAELPPGSNANTRYGITFNWLDEFRFYRFLVSPATQEYWIYKYQKSWVVLAYGTSSGIHSDQANRLTIERMGTQVRAYANGQLLVTLPYEVTYQGGQVGLTILTAPDLPASEFADAAFDYYTVWKLKP